MYFSLIEKVGQFRTLTMVAILTVFLKVFEQVFYPQYLKENILKLLWQTTSNSSVHKTDSISYQHPMLL